MATPISNFPLMPVQPWQIELQRRLQPEQDEAMRRYFEGDPLRQNSSAAIYDQVSSGDHGFDPAVLQLDGLRGRRLA